jgi:hypothetical protein
MKEGIHAETKEDRLQNKMRGVGSMMLKNGFTKDERMHVARDVYRTLARFPNVDRKLVFSAFFHKGELSEDDWKLVIPPLKIVPKT